VVTDRGEFASDFFIDCTGFRGLLINKLKDNNWTSFEKGLPCNRAVAIQKPYDADAAPKPYTVATAIDNGWVWQIGLSNREGTGYVYDGNRLSEEQAEQELRQFLGASATDCKARHLKMNVGCLKEHWVGNCVAIGLSGGFIEPLESTGLHLINVAARQLSTHLASKQRGKEVRASFNNAMNGVYDDLKQFIVLHYCLTDRDDTEFWRYAQNTVHECPGLQEKLTIWKHKICEFLDLAGAFATSFTDENYRYVLYGMGHLPELANHLGEPDESVFARVTELAQNAEKMALPHKEYLDRIAAS
jgi:tryptophan halogenase